MIDLKIVNIPRQGSCILGLITAPDATGKNVSVISDYRGMSVLIDSINYLDVKYSSDPSTAIGVSPGTKSIYEQNLEVTLSSDYYVETTLLNDKFTLTNKSICNRSVNAKSLTYYEFDPICFCWKSDATSEDYETLRSVGLEIINNLSFYTISGNKIIPPYDINIPKTTYNNLPLPTGVYCFKLYFDAVPMEPLVLGFDSYNISTGKIDYKEIPINLTRIYDRTEDRDLLSIETYNMVEYNVPYTASSDEFGATEGINRMTVVGR